MKTTRFILALFFVSSLLHAESSPFAGPPLLIGKEVEKPFVRHEVVGFPDAEWRITRAAVSPDGKLLALACERSVAGTPSPKDR
jgi:hypothetical protein